MIALSGVVLVVIIFIIVIAFFAFLYYFPIGLWIRTIAAGVPLGIIALVRMRLIGIPPSVIVTNYVRARKAGLNLSVDQMQSHFLAGGNVENVTLAMIAAQRAQIPLEWQRAAAIDLAGRNVLEALQTSVNPKVIETPIFQGVAQNGIQLNVKARITVRSNLDRYVGGAGEPTIVARVGEGVVSAVGAAIDHKEVLEYPDRISKAVLRRGSMPAPLSRSSRSTSPTSTSERTSARNCRRARPKPIAASRKRRRRSGNTRRSRPSKSRRPRRRRCAPRSSRLKPRFRKRSPKRSFTGISA